MKSWLVILGQSVGNGVSGSAGEMGELEDPVYMSVSCGDNNGSLSQERQLLSAPIRVDSNVWVRCKSEVLPRRRSLSMKEEYLN